MCNLVYSSLFLGIISWAQTLLLLGVPNFQTPSDYTHERLFFQLHPIAQVDQEDSEQESEESFEDATKSSENEDPTKIDEDVVQENDTGEAVQPADNTLQGGIVQEEADAAKQDPQKESIKSITKPAKPPKEKVMKTPTKPIKKTSQKDAVKLPASDGKILQEAQEAIKSAKLPEPSNENIERGESILGVIVLMLLSAMLGFIGGKFSSRKVFEEKELP